MGKRFILFMKDRHLGYKNLKIKKISIPKIDKPSSGYHEFLVEILVVGFPTHDYYDETILAFYYLVLVLTRPRSLFICGLHCRGNVIMFIEYFFV